MAEPGITISGTQAGLSAAFIALLWPAAVKIGDWITQLRGQKVVQAESVTGQLNKLIDQLQEETARATATARAYEADLKLLRRARWGLDDTVAEIRNAALAARTMVHELQRRLGEAETLFPPLPRPGQEDGEPR